MSATAPSTAERNTQPLELAADQVFDGVYNTFVTAAQAKKQRTEFRNGETVTVDLNPAAEFVNERFTAARERIASFDTSQGQAAQVRSTFMHEATAKASEDYGSNTIAIATRVERADRLVGTFIDRATEMVRAGETDDLTVKTFFGSIDGLKHGLSQGYNDLVRKTDEPMPGHLRLLLYLLK
jgi:hypothetical protein